MCIRDRPQAAARASWGARQRVRRAFPSCAFPSGALPRVHGIGRRRDAGQPYMVFFPHRRSPWFLAVRQFRHVVARDARRQVKLKPSRGARRQQGTRGARRTRTRIAHGEGAIPSPTGALSTRTGSSDGGTRSNTGSMTCAAGKGRTLFTSKSWRSRRHS